MNVRDIMTKDPACCIPESRLSDVARMMVERDCGQIPVVDSEDSMRPVGVVTDRDIIIRAVARGKNPLDLTARDVMTSPAVTVTPEITLEDCCETLEARQLRRVPVVDDDGHCSGVVSQADIAQHAPKKLTGQVVRTVSQPNGHAKSAPGRSERPKEASNRRRDEPGRSARPKKDDETPRRAEGASGAEGKAKHEGRKADLRQDARTSTPPRTAPRAPERNPSKGRRHTEE